jgi:hypothetical protein
LNSFVGRDEQIATYIVLLVMSPARVSSTTIDGQGMPCQIMNWQISLPKLKKRLSFFMCALQAIPEEAFQVYFSYDSLELEIVLENRVQCQRII